MAKLVDQVKVSGIVTTATHEAMLALARNKRTTVGAIVSFAVPFALRELVKNPRALRTLERDRRLPEAS